MNILFHRGQGTVVLAAAILAAIAGTSRAVSIQSWIDVASPGDTIVIPDGTYFESLLISTPNLTLRAAAGASPVIDAGGVGDAVVVNAQGIILNGLELTGATSGRGLLVTNDSSAILHNVSLTGNQVNARVQTTSTVASATSLTLDGGNVITNTAATTAGIVLSGQFATLAHDSFNETAFLTPALGGPDDLIRLENFAYIGPELLAAGNATFNGVAGMELTSAQLNAFEAQVNHFPDGDDDVGLVVLEPSFFPPSIPDVSAVPTPAAVSAGLVGFAFLALRRGTRGIRGSRRSEVGDCG